MDNFDLRKYLAEGRLLKEELTWYIEDENEDIRFQNDEYLREVGKKIKEIHPDISDEDLNKIIIMAGEQYSREEDFHGDSIPSSNFVNAAVEIYQTDVLGSGGDKDFDRSSPEDFDGDFHKDSMFAGWTRAQYDAYIEDPYAYLKDKTNPRLKENKINNFDLRKYLAEGKLLKENQDHSDEEDLDLHPDYDKGGKYYSEEGAEAFRIQPFKLNDIKYTQDQAVRQGKYIVGLEGEELEKFISAYMDAWKEDVGDTPEGRTFK
jgi:hypothetical protein